MPRDTQNAHDPAAPRALRLAEKRADRRGNHPGRDLRTRWGRPPWPTRTTSLTTLGLTEVMFATGSPRACGSSQVGTQHLYINDPGNASGRPAGGHLRPNLATQQARPWLVRPRRRADRAVHRAPALGLGDTALAWLARLARGNHHTRTTCGTPRYLTRLHDVHQSWPSWHVRGPDRLEHQHRDPGTSTALTPESITEHTVDLTGSNPQHRHQT